MTSRMRSAFWSVLTVAAVAVPAQAGGDPFMKERQGRLSHEMNMRALAAENGGRLPGARAQGRGGRTGLVTAVLELESGADAAAVKARVVAAGGRVMVGIDHLVKVQVPAT